MRGWPTGPALTKLVVVTSRTQSFTPHQVGSCGEQCCRSGQKGGLPRAELSPAEASSPRFTFSCPARPASTLPLRRKQSTRRLHTPRPHLNALGRLPRAWAGAEERAGGVGKQPPGYRQGSGPTLRRCRPGSAGLCLPLAGRGRRCREAPAPASASCSRGQVRRGRPRGRAGTPPAPSLHYRTAVTKHPGHCTARSGLPSRRAASAAQPSRRAISLRRPGPPAGAARHRCQAGARWRTGAPEEDAPPGPLLSDRWGNGRAGRHKGIRARDAGRSRDLAYGQD